MATTRLIPMHRKRGQTAARSVMERIAYAVNPSKTDGGTLVTGFGCAPETAAAEMLLVKRDYEMLNGSESVKPVNVLLYQIRQSFKPGELTPEEANRIGYELALRFTKERHQFIVATHVDREHIHNHIIFNSTVSDGTRKFKNFLGSSIAVRHISDRICLEHGVSIIENPAREHVHYGKWMGDRKPPSQRDILRQAIDAVLAKKPCSFDAFLDEMRAAGYTVKQSKHTAFRSKEDGKFVRLRSLGDGYSEREVRAVISGEKEHTPQEKTIPAPASEHINLLVDIQAKLQAGKGVGYEHWAKKFNLKQAAQTINYLSEHDLLDYEKLAAAASEASTRFRELSERNKVAEARLKEISALRAYIFNYRKTRDVYTEYRKAGYNKQFFLAHEAEISMHKAAKTAFDALPDKKVPTIKALQEEYAAVLAQKKSDYRAYVEARQEMQDVIRAKANVDTLLGKEQSTRESEKER